ncbi:hypothetical protein [Mesorhizobium sp. KR9-304]|uniref:hypothetical protein n=1 Tax=Mesorhizobium sp. KR9-304 TaxID=3156614 RepID=UPI0032B5D723
MAKDTLDQYRANFNASVAPFIRKEPLAPKGLASLAAGRLLKTGDICDQLIAEPCKANVCANGFKPKEFLE